MSTEPESADRPESLTVDRVVSGGQTGVDRAGLDVAIELGIDHGGWCPNERRAEDGRIPDCYRLTENDSPDYAVRTEQNVIDSDGTLILYFARLRGGTELTYRLAQKHRRPCFLVDLHAPKPVDVVQCWIREQAIRVLNIAGPRASQNEGIYEMARSYLESALGRES
jgi:hypothetical protein